MRFQITEEFVAGLQQAIQLDQQDQIKVILEDLHPSDVDEILEQLTEEETNYLFGHIFSPEFGASVLAELDEDDREKILERLSSEEIAKLVIEHLDTDDATDIIGELPEEKKEEVLAYIEDKEHASDIVELLNYDEDTAGGLMATELVDVRDTDSIGRCVELVKKNQEDLDNIYTIYVIDEDHHLTGILPLKYLVLHERETLVKDVFIRDFRYVNTDMKAEEVAKFMEKYDLIVLPVVDSLKRLVGKITIDDVVDVIREEETEDAQKMAAMEVFNEDYLGMSVPLLLKKRVGWLILLFIGESLTATAMSFFEHELEKYVALALFIPLIISSGGNTGSQVSTLVIRALALGEVTLKEWWRIFRKEIKVGFLLGLVLGILGFLRVVLWRKAFGENWEPLSIAIGISLVGVVLWGNLVGSLFPLFLKRLGFDPAVSSAPFVATLVDVTGLLIYFSVTTAILSGFVF